MENFKELNLYEDVRSILMQTERIQNSVQEIKHKHLQESLSNMLKNCQADLMVLLDIAYEIKLCETDSDIDELLECFLDIKETVY